MKKTLSVLVAAMMMVAPAFAMADAAAPAPVAQTEGGVDIYDLTAEVTLVDPQIMEFAEDNFSIAIPAEWVDLEMTDEMTANGAYFFMGLEDMSQYMYMMYTASDTIGTLDELIAGVASNESNSEVAPVYLNGTPFVTFTIADANQFGCVTVDASQSGYIWFIFGPNDSADLNAAALQVMSSLTPLEVPAEG